jgi:hypothetical protein
LNDSRPEAATSAIDSRRLAEPKRLWTTQSRTIRRSVIGYSGNGRPNFAREAPSTEATFGLGRWRVGFASRADTNLIWH